MKIEKIEFNVKVVTHYKVEVSEFEGWEVPNTPKDLIEFINNKTAQPSTLIDDETNIDHREVEIENYEIVEGNSNE